MRRCRFFGVCLALWPHLDTATQSLNPHRSPYPRTILPIYTFDPYTFTNSHPDPYPESTFRAIPLFHSFLRRRNSFEFLLGFIRIPYERPRSDPYPFLKAIRGSTCRSMVWRIGLSFLPTLTHLPRTGICAISTVTGLIVHAVLALCHF